MADRGNQQIKVSRSVRRWRYRVAAERAAIGRFADRMDEDLGSAGIHDNVRQSLATVLDELLANVVMHAQGVRGPVHVCVNRKNNELIARLRYCATAFDPTAIAEANRPTTVAAANIGGVGIAMVRAMTHEFTHQYRRGENHLRVRLPLQIADA